MNGNEIKSVMLRIDKELHKQARIKCVENDIKFSEYVIQLIKADLEKHKKSECV